MNLYRALTQPVLFGLDPEFVHQTTLTFCSALGRSRLISNAIRCLYAFDDPRLRTVVAGIDFPNPIGLGAGFDKNGVGTSLLASLGFGYLEIGSISAAPSEGNRVRPRLFRLPLDEALMVYYGVPNDGVEVIAGRFASVRVSAPVVPIGISVVETNTGTMSTAERVIEELATAVRTVSRLAEYLVINLNCPNTPGSMSHFDDVYKLRSLLERLREIMPLPPVFLKTTPPKQRNGIDAVLQTCDPFTFVKGFLLNTHADNPRSLLRTPAARLDRMQGSVTGPVNRKAANDAIRMWYRHIDRRRHLLIGVGGITCAKEAYETMRLGASLVQVVTALVYRGPSLVQEMKRGLCQLLERDGVQDVSEIVGLDNRKPART